MMNVAVCVVCVLCVLCCFFQAEDGIRDLVRSRGLGDVYKRQVCYFADGGGFEDAQGDGEPTWRGVRGDHGHTLELSLIHI